MKLAERITKGHFTKDSLAVKAHGAGTVALCPVPQDGGVMSCVANAELILEAFQVTNETGLSPRELKEQNENLIESLSVFVIDFEKQYPRVVESATEIKYEKAKALLNIIFSTK